MTTSILPMLLMGAAFLGGLVCLAIWVHLGNRAAFDAGGELPSARSKLVAKLFVLALFIAVVWQIVT